MTLEYIFPTPIYYSHISNFDVVQEQLKNAIDNIKFQRNDEWKKQWGETHYMSCSNYKDSFLDTPGIEDFREEVNQHIKHYLFEMRHRRNIDYNIISSWVALFTENDWGHTHHHGFADIAGVYYHKTNSSDGNIFFESPNPYLPVSYCYQQFAATWEHKPEEGKILLFPAWLRHGIKPNKTDTDRISISFNISFNKEP